METKDIGKVVKRKLMKVSDEEVEAFIRSHEVLYAEYRQLDEAGKAYARDLVRAMLSLAPTQRDRFIVATWILLEAMGGEGIEVDTLRYMFDKIPLKTIRKVIKELRKKDLIEIRNNRIAPGPRLTELLKKK